MFILKRLVPAGILLFSVGVLADPYADTALVITDPQIDFLSEDGVTWGVVGASVTENNTVENIGDLLAAAKEAGMMVAISPHYYYPSDHGWKFGGPLEKLMHAIGMFDRPSPLSLDSFDGYLAALINFRYIANDLWTTEEAVELIASTKLVAATE